MGNACIVGCNWETERSSCTCLFSPVDGETVKNPEPSPAQWHGFEIIAGIF